MRRPTRSRFPCVRPCLSVCLSFIVHLSVPSRRRRRSREEFPDQTAGKESCSRRRRTRIRSFTCLERIYKPRPESGFHTGPTAASLTLLVQLAAHCCSRKEELSPEEKALFPHASVDLHIAPSNLRPRPARACKLRPSTFTLRWHKAVTEGTANFYAHVCLPLYITPVRAIAFHPQSCRLPLMLL